MCPSTTINAVNESALTTLHYPVLVAGTGNQTAKITPLSSTGSLIYVPSTGNFGIGRVPNSTTKLAISGNSLFSGNHSQTGGVSIGGEANVNGGANVGGDVTIRPNGINEIGFWSAYWTEFTPNQNIDIDLTGLIPSPYSGPALDSYGTSIFQDTYGNVCEFTLHNVFETYDSNTGNTTYVKGAAQDVMVIRAVYQVATGFTTWQVNNASTTVGVNTVYGVAQITGRPTGGWAQVIATAATASVDGTITLRLRSHTTADTARYFYTSYNSLYMRMFHG